jgi:hypothetical protein
VAKLNGIGFSPVFSANAQLNVFSSYTAQFDCGFHEFAYTPLIQYRKGILTNDFLLLVSGKE